SAGSGEQNMFNTSSSHISSASGSGGQHAFATFDTSMSSTDVESQNSSTSGDYDSLYEWNTFTFSTPIKDPFENFLVLRNNNRKTYLVEIPKNTCITYRCCTVVGVKREARGLED
ncbi:hypothetical protein HAX54_012970, partial [Datura stramonium]|nr:hypothetical protein [Datura stramonium]